MSELRGLDDYRDLADAIPQIVWSTNASGEAEYFNRAWYAYTGQSEAEAMKFGASRALHPDDRERTLACWQRSLETGEPFEIEYRLGSHDGTYRWFIARGRPVTDADGAIARWYGSSTDVDDFKVAEAAMLQRTMRYRHIANGLPQIVWITDGAGKNTFLNERWYEYTGIPRDTPHDLRDAAHPDDIETVRRTWGAARENGTTFEAEFRLRDADGAYRWFLVRAVPWRAPDDSIAEWFGSCTDIDDKRRAESVVRSAYEREHRIAATLQQAFLSHALPEVDGLRFDAFYRPAERETEVGGDWYDASVLEDGRIVVSIGDVAGHGLEAAIVMGNVRQAIRVVGQLSSHDPVAMLNAVDTSLRRDAPGKIVTAFVGIIDPIAATFTFASAGHPPPLLISNGKIAELSARGLPLGLRDIGGHAPAATFALPSSGMLVLYTDGLVESTRDLGEGDRRLREALERVVRDDVANPAEQIQRSVLREGASDDVAVLTVKLAWEATAGARADARGSAA